MQVESELLDGPGWAWSGPQAETRPGDGPERRHGGWRGCLPLLQGVWKVRRVEKNVTDAYQTVIFCLSYDFFLIRIRPWVD